LSDFSLLEQDGCREIAYGLLERFWRLTFGLVTPESAVAFVAFDQRRIAKLVLGFTTQQGEDSAAKLAAETRVRCIDRFSRYVNFLILVALGWTARNRAKLGMLLCERISEGR